MACFAERVRRCELDPMANILGLGLPIGGLLGIKLGVFRGAGILMGFLGLAALGATSWSSTARASAYGAARSLSQATTVRVANGPPRAPLFRISRQELALSARPDERFSPL